MLGKEITIKLDEVFFLKPCLVCSDATSNFILLEKFAANRTTHTWKTLLTGEFIDIPKTMQHLHKSIAAIFKISDEIKMDNKELGAIKKVEKMLIHSEQMFYFYSDKVDKEIPIS